MYHSMLPQIMSYLLSFSISIVLVSCHFKSWPFGSSVSTRSYLSLQGNFSQQRRRVAQKIQNPRLLQITFHTLRHWKATVEYHRTRDILYVKQLLGHKKIENTMLYTQLINFESDEYSSAVAKSLEDARKLVEAGFDYVTDMDGCKLFRRRK